LIRRDLNIVEKAVLVIRKQLFRIIEAKGRGIQKISDDYRAFGTDLPRYEIFGNGIRVHFKALKSALIEQSLVPKDQIDTLDDTLNDKVRSYNPKR
jgi:hypothetical protein